MVNTPSTLLRETIPVRFLNMDHWEIPTAEMLLIHGLIPCGNPGQELVGNLLLQIKKMNGKVKPLVTLQERYMSRLFLVPTFRALSEWWQVCLFFRRKKN